MSLSGLPLYIQSSSSLLGLKSQYGLPTSKNFCLISPFTSEDMPLILHPNYEYTYHDTFPTAMKLIIYISNFHKRV